MATKSLKNVLFDAHKPRLATEGFRLKRSDDEFVRRLDGVSHYFAFVFQSERPGCHVEPIAKVRIDRVQVIFHQFVDWGPKGNSLSTTVLMSLGHCVCDKGRHCEFFVGSGDDDAGRTASLSLGVATSDGQRFRVLRPHARGGPAEVYVALDSELHREVALKRILERHADDPASRQRFVAKAEITGGLEHPGAVPV